MLSLTKMLIGDNYSGDELRYTVNAFSQPAHAIFTAGTAIPARKTGIMKTN